MRDAAKLTRQNITLTEAAKEARREYKRRWNAANRDKQREYEQRYWERKAAKNRQESAEIGRGTDNDHQRAAGRP